MINLSTEALLIIGLFGFYLYDSAMLLYFNEVAFIEMGGRWDFSSPLSRWRIFGKIPLIPNLFTPYKSIFRFAWSTNKEVFEREKTVINSDFLNALNPIRYLVVAQLIALLVVIPLIIFQLGTNSIFLFALGAVYLISSLMVAVTCYKRSALRLSSKELLQISFDVIACPPFSINLVRKLSLTQNVKMDAVHFGLANLTAEVFTMLTENLKLKVDEKLESEEDGSDEFLDLLAYKKYISGLHL